MMSISSRPQVPPSPLCGLKPDTATRGAVRGLGSVGARPSEHKCLEKDPWAKAAAKTEGGMTATQLVASEFDELYPGEVASVRLGRDFVLDGDLVDAIAAVPGVRNPALAARRGSGHLRLVA